jgi:NAD(P)-dependent dehydrogenase (short-subunit alcohol dehydrogenase family)
MILLLLVAGVLWITAFGLFELLYGPMLFHGGVMRKRLPPQQAEWAKGAVFTVGHSTLPIGDFIALLHAYGIKCVADIRSVLRSRHNPQFNADTLGTSLRAHNIDYVAIRGAVRGVQYSASKGGVVSMTRAMALELAPHNIRVNAIAPGTTDTAQPRYGNTEEELIEMARTIPLGGKMLTPDQIARTAVFLASEDANATTGQVIHVNGGSYMP